MNYLALQIRDFQREVFVLLLLDTRHRLIEFIELFHGTINSASVHPLEVAKIALQKNSAAVIVAQNHPSGSAEPSKADIRITKRLKAALEILDIQLLDHFSSAKGRWSLWRVGAIFNHRQLRFLLKPVIYPKPEPLGIILCFLFASGWSFWYKTRLLE